MSEQWDVNRVQTIFISYPRVTSLPSGGTICGDARRTVESHRLATPSLKASLALGVGVECVGGLRGRGLVAGVGCGGGLRGRGRVAGKRVWRG